MKNCGIEGISLDKVWSKCLYFVLVILFCAASTFYFYCILKNIEPCGEDLCSIGLQWATNELHEYSEPTNLWALICDFFTSRYGLSFSSLWYTECVAWFFISFFAFDLAIRGREWKIKWYAIPLFALFLVMVPNTTSTFFGQLDEELSSYPLVTHMMPMFFCVFFFWILKRIPKVKHSWAISLILIPFCYLAYRNSDALFILMFIFPCIFVYNRNLFNSKKKILYWLLGICCTVAFMHILARYFEPAEKLFAGRMNGATSLFYGAGNFTDIDIFNENMRATVGALLAFFGINLPGHSLLDIGNIVSIVRLFFLISLFFFMVKRLKKRITGENKEEVEYAMCIGIILNLFLFLFGTYGDRYGVRYLNLILVYGTVILCWNSNYYILVIEKAINKPILYFVSIIILCMFIDVDFDFYKDKNTTVFQDNYERIINYVKTENLHQGMGSHIIAANVMTRSNGECAIVGAKYHELDKEFVPYGNIVDPDKCFIDYLVYQTDKPMWGLRCEEEEIFAVYGEPDEIIDMYKCKIMIYRNGITLQ